MSTRAAPRRVLRGASNLHAALEKLLAQVTPGRVTTYGALARALGDVSAARFVAAWLAGEALDGRAPVHRVVLRDGSVPADRFAQREQMLNAEGVAVIEGAVDLARYAVTAFDTDFPLAALAARQRALVDRVSLQAPMRLPRLVAGVDVSYAPQQREGASRAAAAYALVSAPQGDLVWSATAHGWVTFPYIPGYLAYRELPLLLELLAMVRAARKLAPLLLVDGNGLLHQRHAGIACHLGVLADCRTVGVGKSLLCGRVDLRGMAPLESRDVVHEQRIVAAAVRPRAGSRPIFVSPGHKADLPYAVAAASMLLHAHRVPEPIARAHAISREAVRAPGHGA